MSSDGTSQPPNPAAIPAGWYSDPAGGNGKRWWDGSRWTENVREPDAAPPAPVIGNYVPTVGASAGASAGASVGRDFRSTRPLPTAEIGIAYSRASWWLAGSPLWISLPQVIVFAVIDALAPPPVATVLLAGVAVNLLFWAILVGLAFADRAALLSGGNDSAASPWWTLLTPLAYLIARARHVDFYATGGWTSVIWWIVATILSPGVAVLAYFAVLGLLPV
jgi:Protein of unknown function (DUF2510)